MNAQFKKGVLELIVLESVRQRDMYGYELVEEVSKVVDVNEGTVPGFAGKGMERINGKSRRIFGGVPSWIRKHL